MGKHLVIGLVPLMAFTACDSVNDPAVDEFGPDDPVLGTLVAEGADLRRATWAPGDEEILFIDYDWNAYWVAAASVVTADIRQVSAKVAASRTGREGLAVADSTGTVLFAVTSPETQSTELLYHVPGETSETDLVRDDLAWPWLAVSGDGQRAAYLRHSLDGTQAGTALMVADLQSGQTWSVRQQAWDAIPVSLSPHGRGLVYSLHGSIYFYSTTTETAVALVTAPDRSDPPVRSNVIWESGEPHLLIARRLSGGFAVHHVSGDGVSETPVATFTESAVSPTALAWAPDRRAIAAWTPIDSRPYPCEPGEACTWPTEVHWKLYLWTKGEGWSTEADVATIDSNVQWLAFAPSGNSIAYSLSRGTYLQDLE